MKIFVSHIAEEGSTARAFKRELERALPGVTVFASTIGLGQEWRKALTEALSDAKVVLTLCSPRSIDRAWVNFESGAGWAKGAPVIPICHDGLRKQDLPDPLGMLQTVDLAATNACGTLLDMIARELGIAITPDFDVVEMECALAAPPPVRESSIGIVLTHGQDSWDDRSRSSPFEFPEALPARMRSQWEFQAIRREEDLLSTELHRLSGLILGAPWRARMSARLVAALVRWVRQGGRLLMLGYELGDEHRRQPRGTGRAIRRGTAHRSRRSTRPQGRQAIRSCGGLRRVRR